MLLNTQQYSLFSKHSSAQMSVCFSQLFFVTSVYIICLWYSVRRKVRPSFWK